MCTDVYFKEKLAKSKASHGASSQLILPLCKSLLSKSCGIG